MNGHAGSTLIIAGMLLGLLTAPAPAVAQTARLKEALTFHASFDAGTDADFAKGDRRLYTRAGREGQLRRGVDAESIAQERTGGRYGGMLRFKAVPQGQRALYRARDNVAFRKRNWSGTVSYWLNLDPNADLPLRYSDPIQLIERRYNDGAIWQDFTDDTPRDLRVGLFPDGPDNVNTEGVEEEDQPVIRYYNPGWQRGAWHHVVITWTRINSGEADAAGVLYLDGRRAGGVAGKSLRFTWDPDRASINVGVNYVGLMDDLALFDRALTAREVAALYALAGGVKDLR